MKTFLLTLLLAAAPVIAAPTAATLRAGAATSNITPDLGGEVVGGFVPFPATHIHDELHARCLVLDDGSTRIAFVVCDLLGLHRSISVEARKRISEESGIPPENVLISGTHTHSAVNALGQLPRGYTSDVDLTPYQQFLVKRIADGVRRASHLLRPAEVAFGRIDVPEHVFNRRWFMADGTVPVTPFGKLSDKVKMNPPAGSPNLTEPAGPIDPALSFLAVREPSGRLISVLSAYSLHYVGGVPNGDVSADYFGMYCEELKRLQTDSDPNAPFVALMANGTSGDINNVNFRTPRAGKKPYEQMRYVAHDIATKVHASLPSLQWSPTATLNAKYRELPVAWRTVEPDLLQWAAETEAKAKPDTKPDIPTVYAGRIKRLAEASPQTKFPVQLLRIGDICIGTSPCETFAETGIEFRERSPFRHSFMIELAHGYYGYMPTPRHFPLGGYETWPGTNSVETQASVKLMDALLEMAKDIAPKP